MSSQTPQVGQDWRAWMEIARAAREPTRWTRPLQLATVAFLVVGALNAVVSNAISLGSDTVLRATRAQNPSMPEDAIRSTADLAIRVRWTTVIILVLALLVLVLGSLLRWRWAFWTNLVWLSLSTIGLLKNLIALAVDPASQQIPPGLLVLSSLLSLAALALLVWYAVALARYGGPWAMTNQRSPR